MLDELERLLCQATPRPWRIEQWVGRNVIAPVKARYPHTQYIANVGGVTDQVGGDAITNARLAAAAVNALPALLAVVRAAQHLKATDDAARATVHAADHTDLDNAILNWRAAEQALYEALAAMREDADNA